jgi:hypothetical protein
MRYCDGPDKWATSNFVKILEKGQWRLWQWLDKLWGRKHEPYMESTNSPRPKKVGHVKSKARSMHQGDCSQIIHPGRPNMNSAYYCDVLCWLHKNVQLLCPELCCKENWLLHHNNVLSHTFFYTREFFFNPILFASCKYAFSKWCKYKKRREEEFSLAHVQIQQVQGLVCL